MTGAGETPPGAVQGEAAPTDNEVRQPLSSLSGVEPWLEKERSGQSSERTLAAAMERRGQEARAPRRGRNHRRGGRAWTR